MVFDFETENWEVWEGPPIGKVLKQFVFPKTARIQIGEDPELRRKIDERLTELSRALERREVYGIVLMRSPTDIQVVKREDLPEEVREHGKQPA